MARSMPVVPFLASFGLPSGEIIGAMRAYPQGGSVWVVLNGAGTDYPPLYADAILEVDMASGRIKNFIDLYAYEAANNPDGNDIDSNVTDIAWGPDGTTYIMETGANTLYTWSAADGLQVAHTWPDNPVPNSIAFASDGSFYIGFLGAGLAPGAAKVEHWSADGSELLDTFGGLTTVTDVAVGADGNVYAVQLLQFGDQGPMPEFRQPRDGQRRRRDDGRRRLELPLRRRASAGWQLVGQRELDLRASRQRRSRDRRRHVINRTSPPTPSLNSRRGAGQSSARITTGEVVDLARFGFTSVQIFGFRLSRSPSTAGTSRTDRPVRKVW